MPQGTPQNYFYQPRDFILLLGPYGTISLFVGPKIFSESFTSDLERNQLIHEFRRVTPRLLVGRWLPFQCSAIEHQTFNR
jgi:hypothetical protein